MRPGVFPSIKGVNGEWRNMPAECAFGTVGNVIEAVAPSGSNHLILHIRPGDPAVHAANGLTCEYAFGQEAPDNSRVIARLQGCYLVQSLSVPTAIQLILKPLSGNACALHD